MFASTTTKWQSMDSAEYANVTIYEVLDLSEYVKLRPSSPPDARATIRTCVTATTADAKAAFCFHGLLRSRTHLTPKICASLFKPEWLTISDLDWQVRSEKAFGFQDGQYAAKGTTANGLYRRSDDFVAMRPIYTSVGSGGFKTTLSWNPNLSFQDVDVSGGWTLTTKNLKEFLAVFIDPVGWSPHRYQSLWAFKDTEPPFAIFSDKTVRVAEATFAVSFYLTGLGPAVVPNSLKAPSDFNGLYTETKEIVRSSLCTMAHHQVFRGFIPRKSPLCDAVVWLFAGQRSPCIRKQRGPFCWSNPAVLDWRAYAVRTHRWMVVCWHCRVSRRCLHSRRYRWFSVTNTIRRVLGWFLEHNGLIQ